MRVPITIKKNRYYVCSNQIIGRTQQWTVLMDVWHITRTNFNYLISNILQRETTWLMALIFEFFLTVIRGIIVCRKWNWRVITSIHQMFFDTCLFDSFFLFCANYDHFYTTIPNILGHLFTFYNRNVKVVEVFQRFNYVALVIVIKHNEIYWKCSINW